MIRAKGIPRRQGRPSFLARARHLAAAASGALLLSCASPLTRLEPEREGPKLAMAQVQVEDHSRSLKHIRTASPSEADTPEARRSALEGHGRWLEDTFQAEAALCGIQFEPGAPYRLDLRVTDLGEVRTKYIVYGIASGVAWGVGTGLVAHNAALAASLGGYELVEEGAFWIGGGSLFSSFSAPAVVEARLFRSREDTPLWTETYYALSGRAWTKDLPGDVRRRRTVQLRASLQKIVTRILADLESIPGFPKGTRERLAGTSAREGILDRITADSGAGGGGAAAGLGHSLGPAAGN